MAREGRCPNANHGRINPPVRFCPMCGVEVNSNIPIKSCSEKAHADRRRNRNTFCADCGERIKRI